MNTVTLICDHCHCEFIRRSCWYAKNVKRGVKQLFCSVSCFRAEHNKRLSKCLMCGKDTQNNKFCSRICASRFQPKKKKTNTCAVCGTLILKSRKFCKECHKIKLIKTGELTLADVAAKSGSRNSYKAIVGGHAKHIAKNSGKLKKCLACGYVRHVECCHIKPIVNFPLDTPILEVNDPDNLVGLCRNHHWELDHGFLDVRQLLISQENP